MDNKIALEWVQERLVFIAGNCDLKDADNKNAYDVLTYIEKILNSK
jgi:hypothetical protein